MGRLLKKARSVFKGTKGETLMEGVVSLLIFTTLIASVTLTIMVSLRVTNMSTREATELQNSVNEVLQGISTDTPDSNDPSSITFSSGGLSVNVPIVVMRNGGLIAFIPGAPTSIPDDLS